MELKPTDCKNCGAEFTGRYCNHCGEKLYHEHDRSVLHFFEEGLHFITHLDGTLFNTVRTMFARPGQLSYDYCLGIRKRYFKPLSFFLLLVVIYLLFPLFQGLNMRLYYYLHNGIYGSYARNLAREVMTAHHFTDAQLSEAFAHKSEKASKFLLMLLIPFTALAFWLLTFRRRRYFFDQMVFSAEINSFFLLWGFLILPVLSIGGGWLYHVQSGLYLMAGDNFLSIIMYLVMCTYVAIGARRFYGLTLWQSIGFALLFYFIHEIALSLYKFLLFVLVIHQIH